MIDIIGGIGKFINDATKSVMGAPNGYKVQARLNHPLTLTTEVKNVPCTNCGNGESVPQPNNNIVFNSEKQNTSAIKRINPELDINLSDKPYVDTSGLKFN